MSDQQARMNNELVRDQFVVKTAAATLTLLETQVRANTTAGDYASISC